MKHHLLVLCLIVISFLSLVRPTCAQDTGLSVTPSVIRLDLSVDKSETILTYTNHSDTKIQIDLSAQDFTELEDGYKLSFLEGKDASNYRYSLSSWVTFSTNTLLLDPGQSQKVTVFITKEKLTPGGHYATILATMNTTQTKNGTVAVKGILSSLLFVRTNTGKEIDRAILESSGLEDGGWFGFPESAFFRFHNIGDTDLIPYGRIDITDLFGNLVAKGIANETSLQTLPESIRRYDVVVKNLQPIMLPGIYTVRFALHYGKQNHELTTQKISITQGNLPIIQSLVVLLLLGAATWYVRKRVKKLMNQ